MVTRRGSWERAKLQAEEARLKALEQEREREQLEQLKQQVVRAKYKALYTPAARKAGGNHGRYTTQPDSVCSCAVRVSWPGCAPQAPPSERLEGSCRTSMPARKGRRTRAATRRRASPHPREPTGGCVGACPSHVRGPDWSVSLQALTCACWCGLVQELGSAGVTGPGGRAPRVSPGGRRGGGRGVR